MDSPEEPDFHWCSKVRLVGLTTLHLNGAIGTVSKVLSADGRIGVMLYGDRTCKSIKPCNLIVYVYSSSDICHVCRDIINLNACPGCGCDPERFINS